MAEIGIPEKRRVLIPQTIPTENPYIDPPVKTPDSVPAKLPAEVERLSLRTGN